ncbi:MAG: hypothetical protein V3V20_00210 [Algisphaera sp.]
MDEETLKSDAAKPSSETFNHDDDSNVRWLEPEAPVIPERLQRELERDRPKPKKAPPIRRPGKRPAWHKPAIIAGAFFILLATWFFWPASHFDEKAKEQWSQLCHDYESWYMPFVSRLTDQDQITLRELGLIDAQANIGIHNFNPRYIAGQPSASYMDLAANPPRSVRSAQGVAKTQAAAASIGRLIRSFERWPVQANLTKHLTIIEKHGWTQAADHLRGILVEAPPKGRAPLAPSLYSMIAIEVNTSIVARSAEALDADLAAIKEINDPVLEAFRLAVEAVTEDQLPQGETAIAHLDHLGQALQPLFAFGERFRQVVQSPEWPTLDYKAFRETGQAYVLMDDPAFNSHEVFRQWLSEARSYFEMSHDWRVSWAKGIQQRLDMLAQRADSLDETSRVDSARILRKRISSIEQSVRAICEPVLTAQKNEQFVLKRYSIERDIADLASASASLTAREAADEAVNAILDEQPLADEPYRSDVIDTRWRAELRVLGNRFRQTNDRDAMQRDVKILRTRLFALVDPNNPRSFPPVPALGAVDAPHRSPAVSTLRLALIDHCRQQRKDSFTRLLRDRLPVDAKRWAQLRTHYVSTLDEAQTLSDLAHDSDRMFREARLPDDPELRREGQTLASRLGEPDGPLLKEPTVSSAAHPVLNRARSVVTAHQGAALSPDANDPLMVLAAWAGQSTATQLNSETLRFEDNLTRFHKLNDVLRVAHDIDDPRQKAVWIQRLNNARRKAWPSLAYTARSPEQVDTTLAWAAQLDIEPSAMPAEMRFNAGIDALRRVAAIDGSDTASQHDAALLRQARLFARNGSAHREDPTLAPWLAKLAALTTSEGAGSSFAAVGPSQMGWELTTLGDDGRATFTKNGSQITFARVQTQNGPCYLAESELAVGIALDAARHAATGSDLAVLLSAAAGIDSRKGPRAWVYHAQAGLTPLVPNPGSWRVGESKGSAGPGPTADAPMNYVSAESAAYLAGLLGCRLPTINEWQSANTQWPASAVQPNLRDAIWAQHAVQVAAQIKARKSNLAWADSDRLLTEAGGAQSADNHYAMNDGVVWLRSVTEEGPSNLRGNVAELVTREPIDPAPMLDERIGNIQARLTAFRRAHKNSFAVLGGSALSAPGEPVDQPQTYNVFTGSRGFADVGLRLAFSAPDFSPAQQIRILLKEAPLLLVPSSNSQD